MYTRMNNPPYMGEIKNRKEHSRLSMLHVRSQPQPLMASSESLHDSQMPRMEWNNIQKPTT